jgi:hypothetical protein
MSKVEQFFNKVDFSGETDLKDRLRNQLFGNTKKSISEQDFRDRSAGISNEISNRKTPARQLSLDELELVNAAGNLAMQQQSSASRTKSKQLPEGQGKNPWDSTFSGKITDHDAGE